MNPDIEFIKSQLKKVQDDTKVLLDIVNTLKSQNLALQNELKNLESDYRKDNFVAQQAFRKDVTFFGKIAFFGKPVVSQRAAITSPSGGVTIDTQARSAIDSIRQVLIDLGITA